MADPKVIVRWKQPGHGEVADIFPRHHLWHFAGGARVSATDCFVDDPPLVDPQPTADGAFTAALASSHLMTFLHVAGERGIAIAACEVDALIEHGERVDRLMGDPEIREVILIPSATYRDGPPAPSIDLRLHQEAHRRCPIANAVKCSIRLSLVSAALMADGHG